MSAPNPMLFVLAAAWAAIPCFAQDPGEKPLPRNLAGGAGLAVVDGALWGVGARYKVRFSPSGFELTPALGAAAPHNVPLQWHLESVGRDGARPLAQDDVVPSYDGLRVEYARGGVRERYDVRPDGIEQSFVLDALPPGWAT